ncbi:MAG: peptide chain release factor N(5)-glutamine methyltransferase [Candidatus Saccharibacteria bacterium]|nr:peptide chain release factor N(5)-glutamine methyltransferase [Candidatus Saccharibacteria bacterium]
MNIDTWLTKAVKDLSKAGIDSAQLDAHLLLAATLYQSREYILSHGEQELSDTELAQADKWLKRRLNREPIAYILGHKEFYGRDFIVSPSVLIPRPESEAIIEILKELKPETIIDIGTGSGCLAISAKLELPNCSVIATDISEDALQIARQNASSLNIEVTFAVSDLLSGIKNITSDEPVTIVANLPYVDESWDVSPETKFEPSMALFADNDGLHLIKKLVLQASKKMRDGDHLVLEADKRQHGQLSQYAEEHGFTLEKIDGLIVLYTLRA